MSSYAVSDLVTPAREPLKRSFRFRRDGVGQAWADFSVTLEVYNFVGEHRATFTPFLTIDPEDPERLDLYVPGVVTSLMDWESRWEMVVTSLTDSGDVTVLPRRRGRVLILGGKRG